MKVLWLVIPCYNEKEVLPETSKKVKEIFVKLINKGKISAKSKMALKTIHGKLSGIIMKTTICLLELT